MGPISTPRPPRPTNDLRTQLTDRIVATALTGLEAGERRRAEAKAEGDWESFRESIRRHVFDAFGPLPFGPNGGPLKDRTVTRFETRHCIIENVLFESYPGWEINASLFIPRGEGPFPAVVLPVGHSGKQFESYQIPAQAFASLGYIAVLFDPPGQSSEKQRGNDHFRDGVRSSLFGLTSNRFFVLDALRCIDYLETRNEADVSRGVGMSGVSGGGITTLFAALFDSRIACFGPSCCLNRLADHPVGDLYSGCPESFWLGRLRDGIDNVDIALASIPTPMLYMAGKHDEVFLIDATRRLVESLRQGYRDAGSADRFDYFEDESGHAYTLEQTARFVAWMNRWLNRRMLGSEPAATPAPNRGDFEMLDYEMLRCRPSEETTMYSIHRDLAASVETERLRRRTPESAPEEVLGEVRAVVGEAPAVDEWRESGVSRLWSQGFSEALARVEGFDIPLSVFRPWPPKRPCASVLYIDEAGRGPAIESFGPAAQVTRMFERDPDVPLPALYAADLPGWGESRPLTAPYQTTPWGSMDRIHAYLSFGNGDGVLGIVSRCVAALAAEIARRSSSNVEGLVLVGRGLGAVGAILAAAISDIRFSLVAIAPFVSFRSLLDEEHYSRPAISFLPGALPAFDLPETLRALDASGRKVLVINPEDARGRPVDEANATELYGGVVDVVCRADRASVIARLTAFIDAVGSP